MRKGQGFSWRAGVVFIVFFLGFVGYQFRDLFTVYENLRGEIKVNEQLTLYITQVESSSLSKDTFHYYLYDATKSADDFMSHVKDIEPVLITNDDKATAAVKDGQVYLRVRGNVYAFRSVGDNIRIHLDISPY